MAITLLVDSGASQIDLNGSNSSGAYTCTLTELDIGDAVRDEVWIEPFASATPLLSNRQDRKTQMTFTIDVSGTTFANLKTGLEAIRSAFSHQNNTVTWSAAGVNRTFQTYASIIHPAFDGSERRIFTATQLFFVPGWTFSVWRHPYYYTEASQPVI